MKKLGLFLFFVSFSALASESSACQCRLLNSAETQVNGQTARVVLELEIETDEGKLERQLGVHHSHPRNWVWKRAKEQAIQKCERIKKSLRQCNPNQTPVRRFLYR